MPHIFHLHRESLKRKFAVYVVIAKANDYIDLYVGKVGDNRTGCNPLISRCGNHFSYNSIHSQIRNKIADHEMRDYTYVFEHFDDYTDNPEIRRDAINRTNEMERWVNQAIQEIVARHPRIGLLNPYIGKRYLIAEERARRAAFRMDDANRAKVEALAAAVLEACRQASTPTEPAP